MKKIYLDHIAGTPVHPEAVEAMIPYLKDKFGNPQSLHSYGQQASEAIEGARERIAQLINAEPSEIFFVSSGSEANNFALKGLSLAHQKKGKHIVLSSIEHQSILNAAKFLEKLGFNISYIPVDRFGEIDPDQVQNALAQDTILVSIMLANGEVGTVQPLPEVAEVCRSKDILLHTDAVDAVGNIPVDVMALGVDALSLAGSQFYGPKGSAAIFIKKGTRILPFIDGGIQEGGRRAGTEDVPAIVGMGKAAEIAKNDMMSRMDRMETLRDSLIRRLPEAIEHVILTGHPDHRLPHHASFCVQFVEGEAMLLNLDMQGIAAASGSSCTSRALKASHVLLAMGIDHALAQSSLVFGMIDSNAPEDIDYLLEVFPPIIERLRKMSPLYTQFLEEKKK